MPSPFIYHALLSRLLTAIASHTVDAQESIYEMMLILLAMRRQELEFSPPQL